MTTVVLVHNAWHGAWYWTDVRAHLTAAGLPTVAPELPLTGIAADVAALRSATEPIDDDIVLCGHSYGGAVVAHASDAVARLSAVCYLCSFVPGIAPEPPGRPTALRDGMRPGVGETTVIDGAIAREAFYGECSDAVARDAVGRLRPAILRPAEIYGGAAVSISHRVPWSYAVCTKDDAMHPDDQRLAATVAASVVSWDTDHTPMLSRPTLVGDYLIDIVAGINRARQS
jgi:pimeloyl-ACP methyl ester carboxylesterase